ncbi:hypothetical protein B0T11DRAFT_287699 [Plectosphaerella cucumerina]|uniref:Secreted protein n=1 Tax=Plectosphaerella cucumerina TaxID=40658 RepID=A0A8K0TAK6_9PEZI|nr:hypothetical protein B0T11DRAFT_287699 [Plectosphaerella cucumerina]
MKRRHPPACLNLPLVILVFPRFEVSVIALSRVGGDEVVFRGFSRYVQGRQPSLTEGVSHALSCHRYRRRRRRHHKPPTQSFRNSPSLGLRRPRQLFQMERHFSQHHLHGQDILGSGHGSPVRPTPHSTYPRGLATIHNPQDRDHHQRF